MPHCARAGVHLKRAVRGVQFLLPAVKQRKRNLRVADLVAQIVGDAAIGINIEEMLMQVLRQKPGGDRKVLVVRGRQPPAISARLLQRWRDSGNGVLRRQAGPPASQQISTSLRSWIAPEEPAPLE